MGVDRISSHASSLLLTRRLLKKQADLHDKEMQITNEKVSQTYQGIALDSQRLINMENERRMYDRYTTVNQTMDIRVQISTQVVRGIQNDGETAPSGGIKQAIQDFREQLTEYMGGSMTDETRVRNIQDRAFDALKSMETFLNEEVNGQFLFSGTSTQTQPVDLDLDSLAAFQTKYDGSSRMYPWTRDAHLDTDLTTAAATTGALTFDLAGGTITAANAGTLSAIPAGSLLTLNGGDNDGKTVTVVSNTGTVITFAGNVDTSGSGGTANFDVTAPADLTDVGASANPTTLSVNSYYSGDREAFTHHLSETSSFTYDLNATHAAFEKAVRAMGIIAQGGYGTTGGLDQGSNAEERTDEAYWLLTSALNINNTGTPPYGTADTTGSNKDSLEQIELDLGFHSIQLERTIEKHKGLMDFLDERVARIENTDTLTVMTSLLDDQQALEASYQVLARVKQLSLSNYL